MAMGIENEADARQRWILPHRRLLGERHASTWKKLARGNRYGGGST